MDKNISRVLVLVLSGLLLVYSGMRSWDFISRTVPAGQEWLAVFALAALDGGVILWTWFYLAGAKGRPQRTIALVMIVSDFVGVVVLFTLDTVLKAGENGVTMTLAPEAIRYGIIGLSVIIALNVGATILVHLFDPEAQRNQAAEHANDMIEAAAIRKIRENADILAAELAPKLAADWMDRTRARHLSMMGGQAAPVIEAKLQDAPVRRRTGLTWMKPKRPTVNYNAETVEVVSKNGHGGE